MIVLDRRSCGTCVINVRFGSKADVKLVTLQFRFVPEADVLTLFENVLHA
jgi:hypothetical protein